MKPRIVNATEIIRDLCDMWGFHNVTKMNTHLKINEVAILEVTHLMLDTDGKTMVEVFKKYTLTEPPKEKDHKSCFWYENGICMNELKPKQYECEKPCMSFVEREEEKESEIAMFTYLFPNGMVVTCDINGNQIPSLQGKYTKELHLTILRRSCANTEWQGFPKDFPTVWNDYKLCRFRDKDGFCAESYILGPCNEICEHYKGKE
jgi:hypothetical protein